ncbi:proteoglycan 4-like [Ipomoea triloba]|uniref:proteoglycan 4-like n=1 Tax=Ipomoea triloba TaxID=35885 RepID=UPI00125CD675|nr:proteoglycan 4-like [Ipomoea triloba]
MKRSKKAKPQAPRRGFSQTERVDSSSVPEYTGDPSTIVMDPIPISQVPFQEIQESRASPDEDPLSPSNSIPPSVEIEEVTNPMPMADNLGENVIANLIDKPYQSPLTLNQACQLLDEESKEERVNTQKGIFTPKPRVPNSSPSDTLEKNLYVFSEEERETEPQNEDTEINFYPSMLNTENLTIHSVETPVPTRTEHLPTQNVETPVPTPSTDKTQRKRKRVDPFEGADPRTKRPEDFPISARPPRGRPNIPPPRKPKTNKKKQKETEEETSWNSEKEASETEEISENVGTRTRARKSPRKHTAKEKGKGNATKWEKVTTRKIINQKLLVLDKVKDSEQISEILIHSQMLGTITNIEPYEESVIHEFYNNLGAGTSTPSDPMYGKIYLRGKFYNFTPSMINDYMGTSTTENSANINSEQVAKELTAGNVSFEKNKIKAASLTSKYAILQKIALVNWMPSLHENTIKWSLAELLYKIGKRIKINFGEIVHSQIMNLVGNGTPKASLIFPNLIYTLLVQQVLKQ